MTVHDTITAELMRIGAELEKLKHMTIHVGIVGIPGKNAFQKGVYGSEADLITIARVHEYGAKIHVQHAKSLTIPIHKKSYGKRVKDFPDLFYIELDEDGKKVKYGVVKKDKNSDSDDNLEFLFLCVPAVTIPQRSYIRASYDKNKEELAQACETALYGIIQEGWDARQAAEYIGGKGVDIIHLYMSKPTNFEPKGSIQRGVSKTYADTPLHVTNRLFNSITYWVEEG